MPKKPNKAKTAAAGTQPKQNDVNGTLSQIVAGKVATLKDLRKATQHTQEDLAHALGVGQGTVSRIEKQSDMLVSTLQHYRSEERSVGKECVSASRSRGSAYH